PRASLASCLTVLARRTPRSTLVPYTTLFRSLRDEKPVQDAGAGRRIYRGSAGRIKRWEPVDPEQETDRTDAGPAGEERTDHALPEPERVFWIYFLPGVRACDQMSPL